MATATTRRATAVAAQAQPTRLNGAKSLTVLAKWKSAACGWNEVGGWVSPLNRNFFDSPLMPSSLELRREEFIHNLSGRFLTDEAARHH